MVGVWAPNLHDEMDSRMTTVARRNPADKAKIDAIEEKLLANPEIAKLIDDLDTSTTDANDLVRGMLQASIDPGV